MNRSFGTITNYPTALSSFDLTKHLITIKYGSLPKLQWTLRNLISGNKFIHSFQNPKRHVIMPFKVLKFFRLGKKPSSQTFFNHNRSPTILTFII